MAVECMKMILQDVFKATVDAWESFFDRCYTHVSLLVRRLHVLLAKARMILMRGDLQEDKIYEHPADESRASELFTNSNMFLKVEKLMLLHTNVVKEMQSHLADLSVMEGFDNSWLVFSLADFERLSNLVQEDLVKPTANLADLVWSLALLAAGVHAHRAIDVQISCDPRLQTVNSIGYKHVETELDHLHLPAVDLLGWLLRDECRHFPQRPVHQMVSNPDEPTERC